MNSDLRAAGADSSARAPFAGRAARIRSRRTRSAARNGRQSAVLPVDAPHADVLDLDVLLDPVLRAFASQAGLLHAAERRDLGGDEPGVHAHHPVVERLGDA